MCGSWTIRSACPPHASRVVAVAMALAGLASPPAARAASPHDQAYLVCANGYEGNVGDCKRVCGKYLKQRGNPLGDMRSTCLQRVNEKPGRASANPD